MSTEFMRAALAKPLAKSQLRYLSERQEGHILCP
jgi:hypothetical protein